MNNRIVRLHKATFKHHNDGKATVTLETGEAFEAEIIIDRDMESLTPSGDIKGNETHIQILHLGKSVEVWTGTVISLLDSDLRYRCDRKVNDDGYVVGLAVTQLFNHDHEEFSEVIDPLDDVVHRSW